MPSFSYHRSELPACRFEPRGNENGAHNFAVHDSCCERCSICGVFRWTAPPLSAESLVRIRSLADRLVPE